jgi:hypothetical protein
MFCITKSIQVEWNRHYDITRKVSFCVWKLGSGPPLANGTPFGNRMPK